MRSSSSRMLDSVAVSMRSMSLRFMPGNSGLSNVETMLGS